MFTDHRARKPFITALTVSTMVLLVVLGTSYALAGKLASPVVQSSTAAPQAGWGDEGIYEVGVEWENVFPDPAGNRDHWDESCDGLYNFMVGAGWTPRFRWTNYDMWEGDAKRASMGGWENLYVDNVDMAILCTHGSHAYDSFHGSVLSAVYYGDSTHTDSYLSPGEAYISYGDKDLEFLAIDSCSVLEDSSLVYWASTFNGMHLLLGFLNNMHVDAYGDGALWGMFMTWFAPSTVTQAWFTAIDYNQPSDVCARVLAEDSSNYNEYWWNTWPDPVVNSEKWYWDHCSHGFIYGSKDAEQPDLVSVPLVQVVDREVNEDYVRDTIAPAFEMTGTIGMDEMFYYMADYSDGITRTLLVDPVTGGFRFQNMSELWTTPVVTLTLPNERIANYLINEWFRDTPAMNLPGALYRSGFYIYDPESIYGELLLESENGDLQGQTTSEIPADVSMTYPRLITTTATTASGTQEVTLPIFGPGARMVVYLGDQGKIIGAQGGSRDIEVTPTQVVLLDPEVVWGRFRNDPNLAIPEIAFTFDTITYTQATLGYYEMPYMRQQDELIPVYQFMTSFSSNGALVDENVPVYLPAADEYMPPKAEILAPADGSVFWTGMPIAFEGSVTGGTPHYTYEWTSSSSGYLGNTINLTSTLGTEIKMSEVFNPTVSFQVTDANGLSDTDTITLLIKPAFWMPFVNK